MKGNYNPPLADYAAIFFISAGSLAFQTTLVRLFSLAQWYHFVFMAVSLALLGLGASGSALYLMPSRWRACFPLLLPWTAMGFSLGVMIAYLGSNFIPFDSYRIAWDSRQYVYLIAYYLAISVPFFWSGLVVGAYLAIAPERSGSLYAVNLGGSALGCLTPLLSLPLVGGEGTVLVCILMGLIGGAIAARGRLRWLFVMLALAVAAMALSPPPFMEVRLSPYKELAQIMRQEEARVILRRWNAFSRIDVVDAPGFHSAPGLSLAFQGDLPPQIAVFTDGSDPSPVTPLESTGFLDYTPMVLPYLLKPDARVLIIEPRGGLEVLAALKKGASAVVVTEGNPLITWLLRGPLADFSGGIYSSPKVRVIEGNGRGFLRRTQEQFDIIILSLFDSRRVVTSGAYSLGENYLYTVEAFVDYLGHLREDGLLVVQRWLQLPPSESLKAGAIAFAALKRQGVEVPGKHIVVIRSWSTALLLIKRTPFTEGEIRAIKDFCRAKFDLVYYPGMPEQEANLYNVFPEPYYYRAFAELMQRGEAFWKAYPFDVSPPGDDRPFFFNFFRWGQTPYILKMLGKAWLPFGGSGYLVLIILLVVTIMASVTLIIVPLLLAPSPSKDVPWQVWLSVLGYFGCLGAGYMLVEIPLIQRFILFLDYPIYAFAAVVASLLVFSGVGSHFSSSVHWRGALALVAFMGLTYPFLLQGVFYLCLKWPLALRLLLAAILLAPLGFFMGVAFPRGIALVGKRWPSLVPWAWAVNGTVSVVSSVGATMLALSSGFRWVLVTGSLSYLGALLMAVFLSSFRIHSSGEP